MPQTSTLHQIENGPSYRDQRQLLRLIHRASGAGRQMRRLLAEYAEPLGVSDGELLVVWLVCEQDSLGMVQGDLAASVGASPAQMSGLVERLRKRGLIDMHRSAVDRRRQVWRATALGRELLVSALPLLAQLAAQVEQSLSTDEQEAVLVLCDKLTSTWTGPTEMTEPCGDSLRASGTRLKSREAA